VPRGFSVATVRRDSPAHRAGVEAGDRLLMINGSYFYDLLDYYYLCADAELTLTVINKSGASIRRRVRKNMMKIWAWNLPSRLLVPCVVVTTTASSVLLINNRTIYVAPFIKKTTTTVFRFFMVII
jgi:NifB/MoaA-like Fe-S oxidoreductase